MNTLIFSITQRLQVLFHEMQAEIEASEQRRQQMQQLEIMQGTSDEFADGIEALAARSRAEAMEQVREQIAAIKRERQERWNRN